jgi:lycopene cyclase domain-containing protein
VVRSRDGDTVPTSYLAFLTVFVAPPLAALAALRVARWDGDRYRLAGVGVLVVLALAYTTPWDNYLVARGVWWYGEGTVAAWLWYAPVEEYLFVAAQTLLTGLWVQALSVDADGDFVPTRRDAAAGLLAGGLIGAAGVACLARDATVYLGAILAWGAPVLALQWAVGWRYLWACRRAFALAVLVPTLYLSTVDRWAIADGVWVLADQYTTGVAVLGLPVEEGAFFLATNVFVAQGLLLYDWVVARWR